LHPAIGNLLHRSVEPPTADHCVRTQYPALARPNARGTIASGFGP
jgi:hypothetical protein